MAGPGHARIVDPLAEDASATDAVASADVPADGGELVAPDVVGSLGVEAVREVRAAGLIAAIEAVPGDPGAAGVVVGQDPPAGSPVAQEGVVTLQVAVAPEDGTAADELVAEDEPGSEQEHGAGVDDTDEWFAALTDTEPAVEARGEGGGRPRRPRKPRPAFAEQTPELPPAPQPQDLDDDPWVAAGYEPSRRVLGAAAHLKRRGRRMAVFAACVVVGLLAGRTLAGGSASPVTPPVAGRAAPRSVTATRGRSRARGVAGRRGHRARHTHQTHTRLSQPALAPVAVAGSAPVPVRVAPVSGVQQAVYEFEDLAQ